MLDAFSCIFAIIVAVLFPIGVLVFLIRQKKRYARSFLIGVLTFFIFQLLLRIPILEIVLPNMTWFMVLPLTHPVLYALFLGFTAGLFEEFGRYIMMWKCLPDNRRYGDAIAFGLGHGGLEAILFVGVNATISLVLYGGPVGISPWIMIAGAMERISVMAIHVGLSVMVLYAIRTQRIAFLLLAVAVHGVIDTGVVLLVMGNVSVLMTEVLLFLVGAAFIVYTLWMKNRMGDET